MWDRNIYYNPEVYNLELVDSVELEEDAYSFYKLAIWKDKEGYYLGTDSGCSCPEPFENYDGKEDLTGPLTAEQAKEEAFEIWKHQKNARKAREYGPYKTSVFERFLEDAII